MKRKPIRVDWDALEEAFARQPDDVPEFLDLVSGHVLLEGEGEDEDFDDDGESYDVHHGPSVTTRDPMRLQVERADTPTKVRWLEAFLGTDHGLDPGVAAALREAMTAADPATRLSAIFNEHADERDAWYGYRARRVREHLEAWLADNGVEPIDPPPWRK